MMWDEVKKELEKTDIIYSMDMEAREVIFNLVAGLKNGVYVEIGTAHGRTLYAAACAAKDNGTQCYGIDDLSLLKKGDEVNMIDMLRGLPVKLLLVRSQDAKWDEPIDVLVIDGCHAPEPVHQDFEKYIPFVKSGGVVVIDDWSPAVFQDPNNAHWGISYYGTIATEGWEEIPVAGTRAKFFRKP